MAIPENMLQNLAKGAVETAAQSAGETLAQSFLSSSSSSTSQKRNGSFRTIILNEKNTRVMEIYLNIVNNLEGDNSALIPGQAVARSGMSGRLRFLMQKITTKNLGGKVFELGKLEVELDPSAEILCDAYTKFLNNLIKNEQGISIDNIVEGNVDSPFVLVYLLLRNLFTMALDKSIEHQGVDGDLIVNAISEFVSSLNRDDVLCKGFFNNNLSAFNKAFLLDHSKWIDLLKEMVKTIRLLHSNDRSILDVRKYVKDAKKAIMCQLIAELNPKLDKNHLHPDFLENTLLKQEAKIINKTAKKTDKDLIANDDDPHSRRNQVIKQVDESAISEFCSQSKKERLKKLYSLLEKTITIESAVSCFDLFNTVGSWVLILSGALRVDSLAGLIKQHGAECATLLEYKSDSKIFTKKIIRGLISFDTTQKLPTFSGVASNSLMQLIDPDISKRLMQLIRPTLEMLVNLEKTLGWKLTDPECLKVMSDAIVPRMKIDLANVDKPQASAQLKRSERLPSNDEKKPQHSRHGGLGFFDHSQQKGSAQQLSSSNSSASTSSTSSSSSLQETAFMKLCLCPLTKKIMTDPVILMADGKTYERSAIENHIKKFHTVPGTQTKTSKENERLIDNFLVREMISTYQNENQVVKINTNTNSL